MNFEIEKIDLRSANEISKAKFTYVMQEGFVIHGLNIYTPKFTAPKKWGRQKRKIWRQKQIKYFMNNHLEKLTEILTSRITEEKNTHTNKSRWKSIHYGSNNE